MFEESLDLISFQSFKFCPINFNSFGPEKDSTKFLLSLEKPNVSISVVLKLFRVNRSALGGAVFFWSVM